MSGKAIYDYDEKGAARILGVAPRTLRRWRKEGKIGHHITPGGRVRYTLDQLVEVRQRGRVAATGLICPDLAA